MKIANWPDDMHLHAGAMQSNKSYASIVVQHAACIVVQHVVQHATCIVIKHVVQHVVWCSQQHVLWCSVQHAAWIVVQDCGAACSYCNAACSICDKAFGGTAFDS